MGKTSDTTKTANRQLASATKPARKHTVKKDADATISVPFEVGDLHIKALLILFRCHHNTMELDYKELSTEMGISEKTKRWQCEAWKDLKTHELIVRASTQGKLKLSDKGVALAQTFLSEEELADYMDPITNEEHHEKIKSRLMRHEKAKKFGPQIFDFLLQTSEGNPMTKHEIAAHFNTLADSHSFFYGFQELTKQGLVVPTGSSQKAAKMPNEDGGGDDNGEKKKKGKKNRSGGKLWKLSEKAFLKPVPVESDD